ncbi:hypothetical protein GGR53DRAFT_498268 [Hypoxylon sp. FL1150]|nr:hypothetical protein GGR53DRAFT_498268 [Hypoxylon sp. FL1150]
MLADHYFRLPKPSLRSFAETDILFVRRISARNFKTADVNAFNVALTHKAAEDKPETLHKEGSCTVDGKESRNDFQ